MSWSFVHGNSVAWGNDGTGGGQITFPSNTAGNLLVVAAEVGRGTRPSISDTAGNIWQTGIILDAAGSWNLTIFYAENCKASAGTNTITIVGTAAQNVRITAAEYSGIATSLSFSAANGTQSTLSTTISSASGDLIVAVGFDLGSSLTVGAGLTLRETVGNIITLADGTASGGTDTVSMSGSSSQQIVAVAFHASPGPSSGSYKGGDYSVAVSNGVSPFALSANFVSNPSGNLLVAFVHYPNTGASVSLSDAAGNTWSLITTVSNTSWTQAVYVVSGCAASSSANTVTATFTLLASSAVRLWIAEYSAAVLNTNATASVSNTTPFSASLGSTNGALVVACGRTTPVSGITPTGSYNARKTDISMVLSDGISTGTTATPGYTVAAGSTTSTMIALSAGLIVAVRQPIIFVVT